MLDCVPDTCKHGDGTRVTLWNKKYQSYLYNPHKRVGMTTCVKTLTAKEAGHRRCIGTKHLCDIVLGAFLLLLGVNTLRHKHSGHLRSVDMFTLTSLTPNTADIHYHCYFCRKLQNFCSIHSPELPPAGIWQMHPVGPLGPSSSSSACDGMCLRNAPTCGTSSRSGRRIPSLLGHLCPASVHTKTKVVR